MKTSITLRKTGEEMIYKCIYNTPNNFSNIIMISDGLYLTGLWFEESNDSLKYSANCMDKKLNIFDKTCRWLDIYFSGKIPDFTPEYKINNSTAFRKEVTNILNNIGYGETMTYNDIAKIIANKRGIKKMSAQAVGGAVGSNPISIIIPCHRVIGANLNITGYGGGINNKIELLKLEGHDTSKFAMPKF